MHTLTVVNEEARPLYSMEIPPLDPMIAVPAILKALSDLPRPLGQRRRKVRKDRGVSRKVVDSGIQPPAA